MAGMYFGLIALLLFGMTLTHIAPNEQYRDNTARRSQSGHFAQLS
jgi:hypothetical protein